MSQAVSAVRCGVYRPESLIPKTYFIAVRQIDTFSAVVQPELDRQVTVRLRNWVRTAFLTH